MQSLSPQPLKTSQVTAGEGRLPKGNLRITRSRAGKHRKNKRKHTQELQTESSLGSI